VKRGVKWRLAGESGFVWKFVVVGEGGGGGFVAVQGVEGVGVAGGGESGEELGGGFESGRGGGFAGAVAAVVFEILLVFFGGFAVAWSRKSAWAWRRSL
jgi:hypothetical protein